MYHVAVDIGCIECGEETNVIGVFLDDRTAKFACDEHELRQADNWHGEHHFEVFEIADLDQIYPVDYVGGYDKEGNYKYQGGE